MNNLLIYLAGCVLSYIFQYINYVYFDKATWTLGHRRNSLLNAFASWIVIVFCLISWAFRIINSMKNSDKPASW